MKPSFTLTRLLLATLLTTALPLAAQTAASSSPTTSSASTPPVKILQLEAVEVLGSRIRRTEVEGPSPVITYDRAYIEATGAMNLADFLNYLPQNYSGIASGRGATPNELNPEFGQRTETTSPFFNFVLGSSDAPPGQTGVSGVSLRGLGSGSTLVLVDGRRAVQSGVGNKGTDSKQGFVDLNGIPLGMIDHIEVITDGASALYGADAVAGVVNIVLKKNWTGSELSGSLKAAHHGGGQERTANVTTGFVSGKLQGSVSVDYYNRAPLKASQRSFSKNQDHRAVNAGYFVATGLPVAGRDLRLNWGYPGVVQARTGNLAGFTLADGSPTRFAIIKDGITGAAALGNFTASPPSSLGNASTLTRAGTANFVDLLPSSERYAFSGNFKYRISATLEAYGRLSAADVRGLFSTVPGVVSASATTGFGSFATIVPAILSNGAANPYNPFGQDVLYGGVTYEFGSTWQSTHSRTLSGLLGVRGQLGRTWRWDAAASWQRYSMNQITRAFNNASITSLLANPDPAARINPFVDARITGNKQAALYETAALYNLLDSASSLRSFDVTADGDAYTLPGGPLKVAVGIAYDDSTNDSTALNNSVAVVPVVTRSAVEGARSSQAAFVELSVPVFGKPNALPLLRRLDLQLANRYENHSPYSKSVPKYGASWVPVQSLLLRGSYSEGFRAPALTEYEVATSVSTGNVTDPKRTPATTTGVTISRGSRPNVGPETSKNEFYGLVFEPPFVKGLNLQANYYQTTQRNVIQILSAATILNNESLFPGRVTRSAPTAADSALNQPGQITAVDLTFINFGLVQNRSLDYALDYTLPWEQLGRFRLGLNASRTLESTRQLAPGQPEVVLDGDTYAPPKWKLLGSLFWNRGPLTASVFVNYMTGFTNNTAGNTLTANNPTIIYNPTPAVTSVDVRGGYSFTNGVWRGYAKGLRVSVGVGNVFDKKPPFSDTVFGYNGGLHSHLVLGRSYQFSFNTPF